MKRTNAQRGARTRRRKARAAKLDNTAVDELDIPADVKAVLKAINNVYPHNIEHLEDRIGDMVMSAIAFFTELKDIPSRDKRAAIYVLVQKLNVMLISFHVASHLFQRNK